MTKSKGKYYLVGGEHDMDEHDKLMDKFIKLYKKLDSVQSLALEHLSKHDYIKKVIEIVDKSYNQLIKQSKTGGSSKGKPRAIDSFRDSLRKLLVDRGMSESEIEALENKEFDADKHKAAPADKHKAVPTDKHKAAPADKHKAAPAAPSDDDDDDEPDPAAAAAAADDDDDEPEPLPEIKIDYAGLKTASEKIDALLDFFSERRQLKMTTFKATGKDLPKGPMKTMMDNLIKTLTDDKMGLLKKDIISADNSNDGTKYSVREKLWNTWIQPGSPFNKWDYIQELGFISEELQTTLLAKFLEKPISDVKPNLEKFFMKEVAGADFDVTNDEINVDVKSNVNYYCDIKKLSKITLNGKRGLISWIWNKNVSNEINTNRVSNRNNPQADRLLLLQAPVPGPGTKENPGYNYNWWKEKNEWYVDLVKCAKWWFDRGMPVEYREGTDLRKVYFELTNKKTKLDLLQHCKLLYVYDGSGEEHPITDVELDELRRTLGHPKPKIKPTYIRK